MPTNPLMSAYQTLASRSTATLNGRALSRGSAKTVIWPLRSRPRLARRSMPNQTSSLGATAMPLRPAFSRPASTSQNCPSLNRPMRLARNCRNHTEPSEPTATSVGTAPPRGRSNVLPVPSAAMLSSWLPFCSVAHTAPSADAADARNGARGEVRVPGAAVGRDREPERLVVAARRRQPLDAAVAQTADRIGMVDGEPDAAVSARRNRDRRILRLAHAVLDEFFLRDGAHQQERACRQDRDAEHRRQCPYSEVRQHSRHAPYQLRNR